MFFTSGIVFLTLVINAPTTGFLIKKLGLAKETDMSKLMLQNVLSDYDALTDKFILAWRHERIEAGDQGDNMLQD